MKTMVDSDNLQEAHGNKAREIITPLFTASKGEINLDFSDVSSVAPEFFQAMLAELIAEFGANHVTNKIIVTNLSDSNYIAYQQAIQECSNRIVCEISTAMQSGEMNELSTISFNLLMKMRELLRTDPQSAKLIFNLDENSSETLKSMDFKTMLRIANSGMLCFQPKLSTEFLSLFTKDTSEMDVFLNQAGINHGY
jgi:hypothetical protein